jgi:hypothetical protein
MEADFLAQRDRAALIVELAGQDSGALEARLHGMALGRHDLQSRREADYRMDGRILHADPGSGACFTPFGILFSLTVFHKRATGKPIQCASHIA